MTAYIHPKDWWYKPKGFLPNVPYEENIGSWDLPVP